MEDFDPLDLGTSTAQSNKKVPYEVAVLVLGICSIVGCFFYGIIGLICGIIAIILHSKDKHVYNSNGSVYESSYKTSKAGYICAIIGSSLSLLYIIGIVFLLVTLSHW